MRLTRETFLILAEESSLGGSALNLWVLAHQPVNFQLLLFSLIGPRPILGPRLAPLPVEPLAPLGPRKPILLALHP